MKIECATCGKLLGEAEIQQGFIEKKCPRCKTVWRYDFIRSFEVKTIMKVNKVSESLDQ